jgi:hypothetical protein
MLQRQLRRLTFSFLAASSGAALAGPALSPLPSQLTRPTQAMARHTHAEIAHENAATAFLNEIDFLLKFGPVAPDVVRMTHNPMGRDFAKFLTPENFSTEEFECLTRQAAECRKALDDPKALALLKANDVSAVALTLASVPAGGIANPRGALDSLFGEPRSSLPNALVITPVYTRERGCEPIPQDQIQFKLELQLSQARPVDWKAEPSQIAVSPDALTGHITQ